MANDANRLFLNQLIPMGAMLADLERQVQAIHARLLTLERLMAESQCKEQIAELTARMDAVEEHVALWLRCGDDIKAAVGSMDSRGNQ